MTGTPPLWLSIATAVTVGAALWMNTDTTTPAPQGSPNTVGDDPNLARLTSQVLELLGHHGVPAGRLKCMAPCPQIGLNVTDRAGAHQAMQVAERTLMSTGYRPALGQQDGQWVISIVPGKIAPSSDKPLRS